MTRAQHQAAGLRKAILAGAIGCEVLGIWALAGAWPLEFAGVLGTPATLPPLEKLGEPWNFIANGLIWAGLLLLMQWLFLRPVGKWRIRLADKGRPMRSAVAAAAFAAMLLTVGLLATLLELPNLWQHVVTDEWLFCLLWGVMLSLWGVWAGVFYMYWQAGDQYTQLTRMIRGLLAGSAVQGLIATGVYAANPHQENCYCVKGSYTGLIFGGSALLVCFGPGILLLFLREQHRAMALGDPQCKHCGYNLRGTVAAGLKQCPECGRAIH